MNPRQWTVRLVAVLSLLVTAVVGGAAQVNSAPAEFVTASNIVQSDLATAVTAPRMLAAANPMPALSKVTSISSAERYRILHAYYTGTSVRLTIDDCATQSRLTQILGFLKAYKIQAIFFFTGDCMRLHPTYRTQLLAAHQLLGNHSYSHPSYSKLTASQIYTEVRRSYSVIPTTSPKLCRPPYGAGAFDVRVYNALATAGCRPVFWTVDTRDWDGSSAATIVKRVKYGDATTPRAYAGGVILLHGTGAHTYEALPGIRAALIYRGYSTFHYV